MVKRRTDVMRVVSMRLGVPMNDGRVGGRGRVLVFWREERDAGDGQRERTCHRRTSQGSHHGV
jgi:hypothetical protein